MFDYIHAPQKVNCIPKQIRERHLQRAPRFLTRSRTSITNPPSEKPFLIRSRSHTSRPLATAARED